MGEESDNESEGQEKDKSGIEEAEEEDQQPEAGQIACGQSDPQAMDLDEGIQPISSEASLSVKEPR